MPKSGNATAIARNHQLAISTTKRVSFLPYEMCILFFTTNAQPAADGYKLILAANRDEFYARPALAAAPWTEWPHVIGGRDMEPGREGGTWLAISAKDKVFRFGALLNITGEPRDKNALARGNLVSDYVSGKQTNEEYSTHLADVASKYNGFNLVTIEIRENLARTMHCCNAPSVAREWPSSQVLAFGNSPPPKTLEKVKAGRKQFEEIVSRNLTKDELVDNLMQLLRNGERHWPDSELLFRAPNWGPQLSSICVKMVAEGYGSRTRTVILVDAHNNVDFYEETLDGTDPDKNSWQKTHLTAQF